MSGPFGSQQWMYSSGFYPHEIDDSVRFDSNSQLSKTPSSAGNRKTYTWSAWFKRSKLSDSNYDGLFSAGIGGSNSSDRDVMYFDDADHLHFNGYASSSFTFQYKTTQQFRDPSAWYHIVLRVDTTYSDPYSADRVRIYINGERITSYSISTAASYNHEGYVNNTNKHTIGSTPYDTTYFDGYIAEVNFIDGLSYGPTNFGETKGDTWIPKEYEGSYGTNGYYLKFANPSSLGTDSSGNGNTWAVTNIVATDQVPDSPTNNWTTLNPLGPRENGVNYDMGTQTQGNLTVSSTSGAYYSKTQATIFPSSGKWYYEIRMDSLDFGSSSGYVQFNIGGAYIWRWYGNSNTLISTGGSFTSLANGDILMFAIDQDNGKGYFGVNGSWYNHSGAPDPAAGTNPHTTFTTLSGYGGIGRVEIRSGSAVNTVTANFGQDSSFAGQATAQGNTDANGRGDFYYSPPAGFLALCTANMSDPVAAINPAVNNSPQDHFNTVLFTANNGTQSITGVGFAPEFIWAKSRGNAYNHDIYDIVRGTGKHVSPNTTQAETSTTNTINSFDSDGFTLGVNSNANYGTAASVAWNWKLGGSGVSNSDGTISSTVSANTDAGVSVVTYNGSSAGTVGHGLGSTPKIVIQKTRDTTGDYWWFGTTAIDGSMDFLKLNDTTAKADSSYTAPTSSVFSNVTFSGATSNVAYCFAEVEGFSKFGTYTGNGSADGPFIHTGFRPAFVIMRRTDSAHYWFMHDSKRDPHNVAENYLFANDSDDEASYDNLDLLSNGFKLRLATYNPNVSGGTYLYMAFAEMPFKYANAR